VPEARRILMLGSNFMRSLVRDMVSAAGDLEIVGELDDRPGAEAELVRVAARQHPDFVMLAVREPELADVHFQLLEECPRVKVLAVTGGPAGDAVLWELQPHRKLFGEISPETLLQAFRGPEWRVVNAS
jgi:chemotaxis response regulator CheB